MAYQLVTAHPLIGMPKVDPVKICSMLEPSWTASTNTTNPMRKIDLKELELAIEHARRVLDHFERGAHTVVLREERRETKAIFSFDEDPNGNMVVMAIHVNGDRTTPREAKIEDFMLSPLAEPIIKRI